MTIAPATNANIKQAVPFFSVTNMEASLRFYVDGLGFEMKHWWVPDHADHDYKPDGRVRWCWLQRGDAAVMFQEFLPERRPKETLDRNIRLFHLRRRAGAPSRVQITRNKDGQANRWKPPVGSTAHRS